MKMILPASVNLSRLVISLIVALWLLLCTNPQVYFYILFAPHKIVLYMDIIDVDEDIFYYYKTNDKGQVHEFVFQEEIKRDGVKKGKSFLKSKAMLIVGVLDKFQFTISNQHSQLAFFYFSRLTKFYIDPLIFHPPRLFSSLHCC